MTFVPLALSKDATHYIQLDLHRETLWKKRLSLRTHRPSDQIQGALTTPQLEQPPLHLHTQ